MTGVGHTSLSARAQAVRKQHIKESGEITSYQPNVAPKGVPPLSSYWAQAGYCPDEVVSWATAHSVQSAPLVPYAVTLSPFTPFFCHGKANVDELSSAGTEESVTL